MSLAIFSINSSKKRHHKDGRKKHKPKDDDSSTTSSSTNNSAVPKECPLRFMLTALIEPSAAEEVPRKTGCPLKRIKLSHTIPLCVFVMCNMWLVIGALLGITIVRLSEMGWRGAGNLRDEYNGHIKKEQKEVRFEYTLRDDYHLEK